jgi:molybdopterin synthase sulfur carrier subunit
MRSLRVLFFAAARDAAGCEEAEVSWEGEAALTIDEFWVLLEVRFPAVASVRPGLRLAKNLEYLAGDEMLFSGDEVALIPPVSGG